MAPPISRREYGRHCRPCLTEASHLETKPSPLWMAPALQGRQGDMKRNRNLRRGLKTRPQIPPLSAPRLGFFELLVAASFLKRDRRVPSLRQNARCVAIRAWARSRQDDRDGRSIGPRCGWPRDRHSRAKDGGLTVGSRSRSTELCRIVRVRRPATLSRRPVARPNRFTPLEVSASSLG